MSSEAEVGTGHISLSDSSLEVLALCSLCLAFPAHHSWEGNLHALASSHVGPNLCPVHSSHPAGPLPAQPEGEAQALCFKVLSEPARFAVCVCVCGGVSQRETNE